MNAEANSRNNDREPGMHAEKAACPPRAGGDTAAKASGRILLPQPSRLKPRRSVPERQIPLHVGSQTAINGVGCDSRRKSWVTVPSELGPGARWSGK